jgi:ABC-type nitrate/sulfonate/bicarbonate transport system permease component
MIGFEQSRQAAFAARMASVPLFLLAWEAVVRAGVVNPALFPPPTAVALALVDYAREGALIADLAWSLSRVGVGFFAGVFAGVALGILTGVYPVVSGLFTPIFQMLRPIPPIAFVPIVIVWFGLTEVGKWFLVFWGVFFTVWMASHLGVQRVNETLLRAALSLGTRPKDLLLAVVLPSSLPMIFVGIRTAIGISFYTLVAAELAGAAFGIAYRLEVTQQNMQVASMMAGLVMLGLISFAADQGFGALSRRLVRWKET